MRRLILLIMLVATVGVSAILFHRRDEIQDVDDAIQVLTTTFEFESVGSEETASVPVLQRSEPTIRVASFDLSGLDDARLQNEAIMVRLGQLFREFDVIALQNIVSTHPGAMTRILDAANFDAASLDEGNSGVSRFDLVPSPPVGRHGDETRHAILFDRSSIEIDRGQSYLVNDPDDLLRYEPFVVSCRVRGPEAGQAFTFTLVSVLVNPDEVQYEWSWLDDVFAQVRNDGRREDDVIMVGNFQGGAVGLEQWQAITGAEFALQGEMTNTARTEATENLIVDLPATSEFTGRAGVLDFYHRFNLTLEEAERLSRQLPVWAEFSVFEGGAESVLARGTTSEVAY